MREYVLTLKLPAPLQAAGVVLDVENERWYFDDDHRHKFSFGKYIDAVSDEQHNVSFNSFDLSAEEGENLSSVQKTELKNLLRRYEEEEHYINTGDNPLVSVPPYKMSPSQKELLRIELVDVLEKGFIEKCESPYATPVAQYD
ncbi:hypothetical protein AVEN_273762-1 [Araneus ventricosus]|uniref:Uncharacterized protein n=1 Tax=Araneus ventricosus TaxID=182803 RepID=A0A4Y2KTI9_ARAVE|nr:hypothetical protein AVEN_273762-1 [Araneus ventricosus]